MLEPRIGLRPSANPFKLSLLRFATLGKWWTGTRNPRQKKELVNGGQAAVIPESCRRHTYHRGRYEFHMKQNSWSICYTVLNFSTIRHEFCRKQKSYCKTEVLERSRGPSVSSWRVDELLRWWDGRPSGPWKDKPPVWKDKPQPHPAKNVLCFQVAQALA